MRKGAKVIIIIIITTKAWVVYINQFIRGFFFPCKFFLKNKIQGHHHHQSLLGFQTQFSFIISFLNLIEGSRSFWGKRVVGGFGEGNYIVCMYVCMYVYIHTYIQP
jgi:hypothetical protein